MPGKRTLFNPAWLSEANYKGWLAADPDSVFNYCCRKCMCTGELGNMGKGALNKHIKSKKHSSVDINRQSKSAGLMLSWSRAGNPPQGNSNLHGPTVSEELSTQPETSLDSTSSSTVLETQGNHLVNNEAGSSINKWIVGEDVQKAEALWCLYSTVNHLSCRASNNTSALFEVMFNDSEIAKQFTCAKDKNSYLVSFGLAPYFLDQLCRYLNECPIYSISFDEAYNRVTKREQLDLAVRYWDSKLMSPVTRYIGSEFLGHSTADNLLSAFNKATAQLDEEKIINICFNYAKELLQY